MTRSSCRWRRRRGTERDASFWVAFFKQHSFCFCLLLIVPSPLPAVRTYPEWQEQPDENKKQRRPRFSLCPPSSSQRRLSFLPDYVRLPPRRRRQDCPRSGECSTTILLHSLPCRFERCLWKPISSHLSLLPSLPSRSSLLRPSRPPLDRLLPLPSSETPCSPSREREFDLHLGVLERG